MSTPISSPGTQDRPAQDRSIGELVAAATADISTLMRKEVELAKVEIKQEVKNAGKGAGLFGAAGFTGLLGLLFLSTALAYGFSWLYGGHKGHIGLGFLTVGLIYLVVAGIAALIGKKSISKVSAPEKTIGTVKDDVAFAKHPTSAPTRRS